VIKVVTGNEAAAYGVLLCRPELICAYPITPQTKIPEQLSEFCAGGLLNCKFVNVESEMSAIGYVIGAAQAGLRVFTATSSQGLAWMHEGLHWAAGARLPIVLVNVNRPMAPPWNLTCDQIDSLSQRDTGWIQFYCESNQEIIDAVIQAYRIAEAVSLPCMLCMDGVYLSYVAETIDLPDQEIVDEYLPAYKTTFSAIENKYRLFEKDSTELVDYEQVDFMTNRYQLQKLQDRCVDTAVEANDEFKALFGRGSPPLEEYKCDDADVVVVMSGSAVGTCRYVINMLREKGRKVGLVKLKMFRPFPKELIRKILLGRKKVAIIERDLSLGQCGIFCQEIKWALNVIDRESIPLIYGFVGGLGGADITADLIQKAIMFTLEKDPPQQEFIWLGAIIESGDDYDRSIVKIY